MTNNSQPLIAGPKRIIVVGGSAAGPKAAARARRLDENAEITIFQQSPDLSMASCGYPYYVGGVFDDRNMLLCTPTGVTRDPTFYMKAKAIVARVGCDVTEIDCEHRVITVLDQQTGRIEQCEYDKLVLATGALPKMPRVPGLTLQGVTCLQSLRDADYLRKIRDERKIKNAIVLGGGLIGVETCEALQLAGIGITIIERLPQLLPFMDWQLAKLIENHIRSKGVDVITENGVVEFLGREHLEAVKLQNGDELDCELAVVAIGVTPNSELARRAGLALGSTGGISVNEHLQTSDPHIYAAGDCIECWHAIQGNKLHAPYGDLANLQGRVAGENAVLGNQATFPGTIQTGICKIFDYSAGSTGLSELAVKASGNWNVVATINASPDKPNFMGGKLLVTKVVADADSGRILGAQCVGPGDVSKQIAIWAMAIKARMSVDDMANSDLPYAPPFSLAIDHSIATAHVLQNKLKGHMDGISAPDLKRQIDAGKSPFLVDCRGPDEYTEMHLGIGEHLIPLGALRGRLNELPSDKDAEIVCFCKISLRGYEAARVLKSRGWSNVKVLEGGIMAWPYPRVK